MTVQREIGWFHSGVRRLVLALGLALLTACGGGGGGGGGTPLPAGEVPVVLGQAGPGDVGGHFPFAVGNQWQFQVTSTETGLPTQTFVNTAMITGTRVVGGQTVTVFQESNPDGSGIAEETFLVKDLNGIANFGTSDPTDTVTPLLVPYWEVRFPLETGASFVSLDRKGVDFGEDLDGDGRNETFDLRVLMTVAGFEGVTVPAGSFANCAIVRGEITLSIILSANGSRVPATSISTSWYAPGVGLVRSTETFQMQFQGVASNQTTVQELTAFTLTEPPPAGTFALVNDSYTWLGNSRIAVPAAFGLLANDVGVATITAVQTPSAQGGTVSLTDATGGGFSYEPRAGFVGTDTFTYTAQAQDGSTATGTATITIDQLAWYVMNNFGGTATGSSTAPFATLAAAEAISTPGNTIFVFTGDGTASGQAAGIDLKPNQKLIGQGVGLTFDLLPNDPGNALLPVAGPGIVSTVGNPLAAPVIADRVNIIDNLPIVGLASGVEVAGIILDGTGTLANMNGMSGSGITGFNLHDNGIRNVPRAGIQLAGASGGTGRIVNNALTNLTGANPDNAIDIVTTAAGVDFTLSGNSLNGVSETGIRVQFGSGSVNVTGNTLTNVGTTAGRRGIDVDGAGTTRISNNGVDNTGVAAVARSGIQVNATGTLAASVVGNTVRNATPAEGGIQAQTTLPTSSLCLQMAGNDSDTVMVLDNRATGNTPANFRIEGGSQAGFEGANTGIFSYLADVNAVSFVPAGTCGFAP